MAQGWSSQGGDDPEDIDTWLVRRNAQLALRAEADAVARNLWSQSIQSGDDLYAGNPSDLTAIGLAALDGAGSYSTTAANDDDQGGSGGAFDRPSAAAGEGSVHDGFGATAGRADVGGPHLSRTSSNSSQHRSPISEDQDLRPAPYQPSGANDPTVSELEVVGRPIASTPHAGFFDSLNHNPVARAAGGLGGYLIGLPAGVLRGGWHSLEGVGHGLNFARGLLYSPDARAKAWDDAQTTTHDALQYGRSVLANPARLADDALSGARAANRSLNPFATPIPDTASGAFGHELGIGANGGETLTDIAGLFAAPEVFAGVKAAGTFAATREANVAKMMAQGLDEATARYLSKPYKGQGDHALIQKSQRSILGFETPGLRGLPIPKWFMDGPLNVSIPRGLSQYDFYKYHYGVDPKFYGGRLPVDLNGGKGFSGKRLGFERYSDPGRTWARIPPIWKDYYAGVASGEAAGMFPESSSETPQ
ncbi:hypothetical protein [Phenylobacterium sp.]|jgi:hypothetical protein|uniref:hypothetical protein n=1 Tax=Phenylobacterium sp. TaxID=1871053 RepID=UPI002E32BED6|nr:hypothetical protein [Phenylobacterium sp.]HEX4710317.1 hypothetical protein [Phenylobacterium sp.]